MTGAIKGNAQFFCALVKLALWNRQWQRHFLQVPNAIEAQQHLPDSCPPGHQVLPVGKLI